MLPVGFQFDCPFCDEHLFTAKKCIFKHEKINRSNIEKPRKRKMPNKGDRIFCNECGCTINMVELANPKKWRPAL